MHSLFGVPLLLSLLPVAAFYVMGLVVAVVRIDALGALPFMAFTGATLLVCALLLRRLTNLGVEKATSWWLVLVFALAWIPLLSWTIVKLVCMQFSFECI